MAYTVIQTKDISSRKGGGGMVVQQLKSQHAEANDLIVLKGGSMGYSHPCLSHLKIRVYLFVSFKLPP